jgi:hypothetical protein
MAMIDARDSEFVETVNRSISGLVGVEHHYGGSFVTLPITYPSGASVVLEVNAQRDVCFVSDLGFGFQEAEMMGAARHYTRQARVIAEEAGVGFDGRAIFVAQVPRDRLDGVIVAVGNCSSRAAALAAFKLAEQKERAVDDELYERLVDVFHQDRVERHAELRGASNHLWPISNLVKLPAKVAVFEAVVSHHASVVNAAAKFHDLALLEIPPARVSVIHRREPFKDLLGLLTQSSHVVELRAPKEQFRRYAEAA